MPSRFHYLLLLATYLLPALAWAQTDEIQVYDASIVDPGKGEVTVHANYTPDGQRGPAFPGAVVANHSLNGALESAYGLTDFCELGLYLPVYTVTNHGTPQLDGFKLRSLWVTPHARQREWFAGLNVELSYNMHHWEGTRTSMELRPIIGLHRGHWDLIFNPILDSDFKGFGKLHFAPASRIAYNLSNTWAFGLEDYGDFGPLNNFKSLNEQSQSLFVVADHVINEGNSVEFGIGHGFTAASDGLVLKVILNHDF